MTDDERNKIPWPQILQLLAAVGLLGGTNATTSYLSRSTPDEACQVQVDKCNAQAFDTLKRCIELMKGE